MGNLVKIKGKDNVFIFPSTGIDLRKDTPIMSPDVLGLVVGIRNGPGNMSWVNVFVSNHLNGWIPTHKLEKVSGVE